MLCLCTSHLRPETVERAEGPLRLQSERQEPFKMLSPVDYGYFCYAYDENAGVGVDEIPPDLWACCEYAREHGFSHIRFDRDAEVVDGLTDYQPEWDTFQFDYSRTKMMAHFQHPNYPIPGYEIWDKHPGHCREDWMVEISEGATLQGYWSWVRSKMEEAEHGD